MLRASIASASNDYRLGANEAPPAIISVFIGSQLSEVLDELESTLIAADVGIDTTVKIINSQSTKPHIFLVYRYRCHSNHFILWQNTVYK